MCHQIDTVHFIFVIWSASIANCGIIFSDWVLRWHIELQQPWDIPRLGKRWCRNQMDISGRTAANTSQRRAPITVLHITIKAYPASGAFSFWWFQNGSSWNLQLLGLKHFCPYLFVLWYVMMKICITYWCILDSYCCQNTQL